MGVITQRAQIELAVQRITRFSELQRTYSGQLNDIGERLVQASLFTAYCDCRTLGVGKRADQILANHGIAPVETGRDREREPA